MTNIPDATETSGRLPIRRPAVAPDRRYAAALGAQLRPAHALLMMMTLMALMALAGQRLVLAGGAPQGLDYRLTPRELAPGVHVLIGTTEDVSARNGGNIVNTGFLVGKTGIVVIDTGPSRRYGEQMLAAIRRVSPLPVVLTLNTHHHPDHFLGNQAFPADTLAALPDTVAGIRDEGETFNDNLYRLAGDWMRGTEVVAPRQHVTPGRRMVGGRDIELRALSGHTGADLVVIDHASGVVFAGDLLFHDRTPTTPHADIARWLASLAELETLPARLWVPGHGEPVPDLSAHRQTADYLNWLAQRVTDGAAAGLDMTELLAQPVPERFRGLAEIDTEYRRSVMHLFPAAEQAALERRAP